ncbi:DNA/RNA helicase [Microbacteriaceae bacterium VKM Ac-2855]|nr:DNA/RNA helicase [Microbacteriaceae bacterium VKM Ac-2855]
MRLYYSVDDVTAFTSASAVSHGIGFVSDGEVILNVREGLGFVSLAGTVGSGPEPSRAFIELKDIDGGTRIDGVCDCGQHRCPHLAATLIAYALQDVPLEPPPPVAPWQRTLDGILGDEPHPDDSPAALVVDIRQPGGKKQWWQTSSPKHPYLAIRPAVRGARDNWIRGGTEWGRLGTAPIRADHLALLDEFTRLYLTSGETTYSYLPPEWLPLDTLNSRALWSLIEEAQSAGIELIYNSKSQPPIRFGDQRASVELDAKQARKRLRIDAQLAIDGEPASMEGMSFIGRPGIGVARIIDAGTKGETVELLRTREPIPAEIQALLRRKDSISVTEEQRPLFESEYLPRLTRLARIRSTDGSYEPPAPPRPVLVLGLTHEKDAVTLDWTWRRGRAGTEAESEITAAVIAGAGAHPHLLAGLAAHTLTGGRAVLFLGEVLPRLRALADVEIVENEIGPQYSAALEAPVVQLSVTGAESDWFDLSVEVSVGDEKVVFAQIFAALVLGDPVFLLPSGRYFSLQGEDFDRLRMIIEEARMLNDRPVEHLRLSRYQVDLWQQLVELGVVHEQEEAWRATVEALSSTAAMERVPVPGGLDATLRDYQRTGLDWMDFLRRHDLGGILGDDMGLGKTVQAIAMMEIAREESDGAMPPFLVVAPTSVVGNWASECAKFAPGLSVVAITETQKRRGAALADAVAGAHVVVTSYALFRLEFERYSELEWSGLLLDEAQVIKNHTSRGYKCARMLDVPFKLAITGTPLENNVLELWSIASLVCPGLLGGVTHFTEYYRQPIEREHDAAKLAQLTRRLRPFLLRRTKSLVAADLPEKQEQTLELDLHPEHREIYQLHLQRERQKVLGLIESGEDDKFQIFRSLTMLRQLALDASLVDEDSTAPSVKLEALGEILEEAAAEGHRVVVFSQFTRFLTRAREAADARGITSAYLDGSTRKRADVIDGFRQGDASVFFISLKAGGFGLNLTEADYVILLDPWWNPAAEAQAVDRTHRIGQTRPVVVYRLVARGTIEAKVMALKDSKSQLFNEVLDGDPGAVSTLTADDIRGLLD